MTARNLIYVKTHRAGMACYRRRAAKLLAGPVSNVREDERIGCAEDNCRRYQAELRNMLNFLGLRKAEAL